MLSVCLVQIEHLLTLYLHIQVFHTALKDFYHFKYMDCVCVYKCKLLMLNKKCVKLTSLELVQITIISHPYTSTACPVPTIAIFKCNT